MAIPKTGVKIMNNNIHPKTVNAPPHSKLKPSGQTLDPYPTIMNKKVKKKKKKAPLSSVIPVLQVSDREFHELVAR